ncbi:MAG: hypothetical protein GX541_07385 [Clostridiales bacterium]|nr:hypothetical protein [Clostridiales bacterium]
MKYSGLGSLIENDPKAREYYNGLPDYVREQMKTRDGNINSFESLRDYAENLLRGDD